MSYYDNAYKQRLERFGVTRQEQLQNKRKKEFGIYKSQSAYKISFQKGNDTITGVLEPNKQDETKTTSYLLTDLEIDLANGEIYSIAGNYWMVFYADYDVSRGYNKYIVLKMTHSVSCTGKTWSPQKAYYFGSATGTIKDLAHSFSQSPVYEEKNKTNHIIMPYQNVETDDYIKVSTLDGTAINEDFLITGFDQVSVPGVIYITVNQTMKRDEATIDTKSKSVNWLSED